MRAFRSRRIFPSCPWHACRAFSFFHGQEHRISDCLYCYNYHSRIVDLKLLQTFRNQSETGLVIIPAHPSARLSWNISCTCIFRHAAARSRNALCDPNKRFPWRLPSAHQDPAAAPSLYSLSRPISFNATRTRCATASSRIPGPSTTQTGGLPIISRPRIRRPGRSPWVC